MFEQLAELGDRFPGAPREIEPPLAVGPLVDWRPERTVDVVGPEVDVERLLLAVLGLVDERDRRVDESAGDLGTRRPDDRPAQPFGVGPDLGRFAGQGEASAAAASVPSLRNSSATHRTRRRRSAARRRRRAARPDATCQKMPGGVAAVTKHAGERRRTWIQPLRHASPLIVGAIVQIRSDPPSLRILAGGQATRQGEQIGELT